MSEDYTKPAPGEGAVCGMCNQMIYFSGAHWMHFGQIQPRHPAIPEDEWNPAELQPTVDPDLATAQRLLAETEERMWKLNDELVKMTDLFIDEELARKAANNAAMVYFAALMDIREGAEQRSQSHVDVLAKIDQALSEARAFTTKLQDAARSREREP